MKKIIPALTILFLTLQFLNAQISNNYTAKDVAQMAVFPGCEKFNDKKDLQSCISEEINKQLVSVLDPQIDFLQGLRMKEIVSKLNFVITKNGKISGIEHAEGNYQLNEIAITAFQNYAKNLQVKPASIEDGTLVNLVFQLPIKVTLNLIWQKEKEIFEASGVKELVYLTLNENDETYEIRLKQDLTFSIYKINNDKYEFLGNVMNWLEFRNMEPYSEHVNKLFMQQWELITESKLNGENYRIYRWGYDLEYVRVYKLINGKEELVLKSNRFKKFKKSPYIKLLHRN